MKKKTIKLMLALSLLVTLASCGTATNSSTSTSKSSSSTETTTTSSTNIATTTTDDNGLFGTYTAEDQDSNWDETSGTTIQLNKTSIKVDGSGASATDSIVTITAAGTYIVSGTLTDGQIKVNASKEDTVRIILNGVDITSSTTSPIYVQQADKMILTLADKTENKVSDATEYSYPDITTDEPDAAIFSKDDLTINGSGALNISGNYNNGIASKDDLVITDGTITVDAKNHALRGKDSVSILAGTFVLKAGNDGIQTNNSEDTTKGWIGIDGGTYTITAAHDGIQAESSLLISNGNFTIKTGAGSDSQTSVTTTTSTTEENSNSYKALKATEQLTIQDGSFTLNAEDDALHTNGIITINGGEFSISTGDDGMHADDTLTINAGTIDIKKSYEGLEAAFIVIKDGTIHVTSSDDGINAAGGSDGTTDEIGPGGQKDNFSSGSDYGLTITGGRIVVDAGGDGLDSNGDIDMSGGVVLVNGPTDNGNGAIDFDGTFNLNGGTLVASGSSGMAETPSTSSTQASLNLIFSNTQQAGTLVHIEDENGDEVLTFAPTKNFQSIVISTPDMLQGSKYTLYSGGSHSGTTTDGLYQNGSYTIGTQLTTATLTDVSTSISETGASITTGGMGGGGGRPPGNN